ncbi:MULTISPECIES: c-type cytochrome [Microbacterium]|uniref:Cytochrome bc1 complex cytochrome c subunit n=1 Tax=Microbacterium testaceum TaxID=2033 RepID=A0A2T7WW71_MICTE|nr:MULTISPECIES: cytochrome c [Microbacterium]PTT17073.1 cystathionine beta-lyase [Microbacterium sp. HMWF026]PVE78876.1 cystathionine beta-lyase [Microbacterium testaceum]
MAREKKTRKATGRRSPLAAAALIGIGLLLTGGVYAGATAAVAATSSTPVSEANNATAVEEGQKLFQANCATCHGLDLQGSQQGPSLFGVGELSVHFQVSTGRMPLQAQGPQAPVKPVQFTEEQTNAIAAYVQSAAPGPAYPSEELLDGQGDLSHGAELFRINCAMCHNVAGAGGALTEGKYAPDIHSTTPVNIYAAMVTGPQNMPVFNDLNLTPEDKRDVISYLMYNQQNDSPGGFALGSLGPVSEGLFIWIFGIGGLIALTVWITAKSN